MREADDVREAARLQSFEQCEALRPREQVVDLVDVHAAAEVIERTVDLLRCLAVIRRPDLGRDDRPIAPPGERLPQHALSLAVHRR